MISYNLYDKCRKSEVHVIDAKTMSADPIAIIHLPSRVPYGFHAFFVTEVSFCITLINIHCDLAHSQNQ